MKRHQIVTIVSVVLIAFGVYSIRNLSAQTGPIRYFANSLEISQAQQADPRISPTLVGCDTEFDEINPITAKRRTGFRLYVTQVDAFHEDLEGYLVVKRNGSQVWTGRSLNTVNTANLESDACDIDRSDEDATLNFETPYKIMTIGLYEFVAYVIPVGGNPFKNDVPKISVTNVALNRKPPNILGVPIDYRFPRPVINFGTPDPNKIDEGSGVEDLLWGVWPIAEPRGNKRYHYSKKSLVVDHEIGFVTRTPVPGGTPVPGLMHIGDSQLMWDLNSMRIMTSPRPDYVYGWANGENAFGFQGRTMWHRRGAPTGYGSTKEYDYEATFAHEFGHSLGDRRHNSEHGFANTIKSVGWDVLNVQGGSKAMPLGSAAILKAGGEDPVQPSEQQWSHIEQYREFMDYSGTSLKLYGSNPGPTPNSVVKMARVDSGSPWQIEDVINVQTAIEPIHVITDTQAPGELQAVDASGTVIYSTRIMTPTIESQGGDSLELDIGLVELEDISGLSALKLFWDGALEHTISSTIASPVITITSPSASSSLPLTTTVQWEVSDADGGSLSSMLEFTHDAGTTVIPLSKLLLGASQAVTVSTSILPGGNSGSFRVRATDGFNTTVTSVDQLTISVDKPPSVRILSPKTGRVYRGGIKAILAGGSSDLEDGFLPDADLEWSSSIDGVLGTGEELEVSLSAGTHVITLTGTDSSSNTAADSVTIVQN